MKQTRRHSRRRFLVIAGSAVSAASLGTGAWLWGSGRAGHWASAWLRGPGARSSVLSRPQWRKLAQVLDAMIPEDTGAPSATQAGVLIFIDLLLTGRIGTGPLGVSVETTAQTYRAFLDGLPETITEATLEQVRSASAVAQQGSVKAVGASMTGVQNPLEQVRVHAVQGYFADPAYGGNADYAAWESIGHVCQMRYPKPKPASCPTPHG